MERPGGSEHKTVSNTPEAAPAEHNTGTEVGRSAQEGHPQTSEAVAGESQQSVARQLWGPPPTREQVERFFANSEEEARQNFRDRWGFDPSTGRPLPASHWEWQLVNEQDEQGDPADKE